MVQYAVLAEASRTGDLVLDTDNFRLLTQFGKLGIFSIEIANNLRDIYLEFRRYVHRQALLEKPAVIDLTDELTEQQKALQKHRAIIQQLWQDIMERD
jgi:glutamine synthetase adenylyltransferase